MKGVFWLEICAEYYYGVLMLAMVTKINETTEIL